jgi:hypothetical protein
LERQLTGNQSLLTVAVIGVTYSAPNSELLYYHFTEEEAGSEVKLICSKLHVWEKPGFKIKSALTQLFHFWEVVLHT